MSQDEHDVHVELDPGDVAASPDERPAVPPSMQGIKVELDIEDAPFLEEPEEEAPPEPDPEPKRDAPPKVQEKKPSKVADILAALQAKKKLLIFAGAGAGALLLVILLLVLFLGGEKAPPEPAPAPEPEPIHVVAPVPKLEDAPEGPKFLYAMEPFLIERRGEEGEIRFLRCRFTIPTDNPQLYAEMMGKTIALRDSVYYYLINKPLVFLTDGQSSTAMKEDIASVINEHLATEKINSVFIEEYFISGR